MCTVQILQLHELVKANECDPSIEGIIPIGRRSRSRITTNWMEVSKQLNRTSRDCLNKWGCIQNSKLKKGPFTAEEDDIIIKRVTEWGDKRNGLWAGLEKELGRPRVNICARWRKGKGLKSKLGELGISSEEVHVTTTS